MFFMMHDITYESRQVNAASFKKEFISVKTISCSYSFPYYSYTMLQGFHYFLKLMIYSSQKHTKCSVINPTPLFNTTTNDA